MSAEPADKESRRDYALAVSTPPPAPPVRFGTSSFSSEDWVGPFYPAGTPAGAMLTHYAQVFDTVEVDSTWYALPSQRVVDGWAEKTPEGFLLSAKFPRSIVHGGAGARPDARLETVTQLRATIAARKTAAPGSPFPDAVLALTGRLEEDLATRPAIDVEDAYARTLRDMRTRDRAAGRTLEGPHLSDLDVSHGPKTMPAWLCSTGEQKALLINLVLGHATLLKQRRNGAAPILLLDEIAAHLDRDRREALFSELLRALGSP